MIDLDLPADHLVRVGVDIDGGVCMDHPGEVIRVRAPDLRVLAHRVTSLRREHPGVPVLADVQVMIAADARSARAAMTAAAHLTDDTLVYVGTPAGLAGLVSDIHALGIADGAVLIPLNGHSGGHLIDAEVLPRLRGAQAE